MQKQHTLIEEIKPLVADASCDVVVCVPYIDLHAALEATKGKQYQRWRRKLSLGTKRRFYRRNLCFYAIRNWRKLCYHWP